MCTSDILVQNNLKIQIRCPLIDLFVVFRDVSGVFHRELQRDLLSLKSFLYYFSAT